ncbi:MAG TPA: hypothetical protein VHB74_11115 [Devosia sp.]|nr:hypothetical protein [Devosia sp.]
MFKAAMRLTSLLVIVAGVAAAQPALADSETDISTPAWTNHDLPLYDGPGKEFGVATVLPGGLRIHVDRCSRLWCHIHAGRSRGFAFLYSLSFGQGPNSWWWPSQARHQHIYIGGPLHGQYRPARWHR